MRRDNTLKTDAEEELSPLSSGANLIGCGAILAPLCGFVILLFLPGVVRVVNTFGDQTGSDLDGVRQPFAVLFWWAPWCGRRCVSRSRSGGFPCPALGRF